MDAPTAWLLVLLCVWTRLFVALWLSPILYMVRPPVVFVILLSLGLAFGPMEAQGLGAAALPPSFNPVLALASEVLLGGMLAFTLHCGFGAVALAGRWLDLQIGFAMGAMLDPQTQRPSSALSMAFSLLAAAVFIGLNGHVFLVQAIHASFQHLPPGQAWVDRTLVDVVKPVTLLFASGVSLALPIAAVLILTELTLSVMSRAMPQMNVFFVGLPLKIMVGLVAAAVLLPLTSAGMSQVFARLFRMWSELLR